METGQLRIINPHIQADPEVAELLDKYLETIDPLPPQGKWTALSIAIQKYHAERMRGRLITWLEEDEPPQG